MNLLVALMFSLEWLKMAGAQGQIADVTGRLGGATIEIDYPGRGARESKLKLLKIEEIKNCLAPKDIREDDIVLIFNASGEVIYGGTVTANGRLRHKDGKVSALSVAAYCSRWRTAAGVKVLRKPWWKYTYTKRECMVPMRDGTALYTAIYEPVGLEKRPIILQRSPYNCCPFGTGGPGDIWDELWPFAEDGYILVLQNVRGTYLSEGEFMDLRPLRADGSNSAAIVTDEATDSYDTIEWLLHNTANNGNVGIMGVSYNGFYATLASVCGHPALKAVSPQAPVTDWWMGDDAHHNGALLLSDMYGFGGFFFLPKLNPTPDSRESANIIPEGTSIYNFFKGKSLGDIWNSFGDSLPFMNSIKEHPNYDAFWKERNPLQSVSSRVAAQMAKTGENATPEAAKAAQTRQEGTVPQILVVGGVYDAEDAWGAVATYRAYKAAGAPCRFVYGPWTHGGWKKVDWYLQNIEYPFFAYYLDGKGTPPAWQELWLPSGIDGSGALSETGAKKLWAETNGSAKAGSACGATGGSGTNGASKANGVAGADEASQNAGDYGANGVAEASKASDKKFWECARTANEEAAAKAVSYPLPAGTYVSDPSSPVPYMDSDSGRREKTYMWADQNFASARPDVLSNIVQGPLSDSLFAIGPVKVHLKAKVEGTDADFIVKLIDVAPDGTQNLVRGDVFPARFRSGFQKAEPLQPGQEFELDFTMVDICHCFAPGHSIMVQVQSSWFPLVAMNPQHFVENPYSARPSDYQPSKITILPGSIISLNIN